MYSHDLQPDCQVPDCDYKGTVQLDDKSYICCAHALIYDLI